MLKVRCERADCGGDELRISERNGVEVDYCAVCRGVWLDRGELDKIIERSAQPPVSGGYVQPQQPPQYQQTAPPPQKRYEEDYYEKDDDDYRYGGERNNEQDKKKRKSSWLGELFDF